MSDKRRNGPGCRSARRRASDEDRAVYADYCSGDTYAAIGRRTGHSPEWIRLAVARAHDEVREARLKAAGI
jgi:hypothetical protein